MAKMGRPVHVATPEMHDETQDLMLVDRFLAVPSFAEHQSTLFTREQEISAVMGYVLTGSSAKAEQISGIKAATIRRWKSKSPWWDDCIVVAKEVLSERFEDKFTALLNESLSQLSQRLDKGDIVVRQGEVQNVPVKASELNKIIQTLFASRQLMRGDVTSRSETKNDGERLRRLKEVAEDLITKSNN